MEYLDHKKGKEEKFRDWVRQNIAELETAHLALIAIARVMKIAPSVLAEAVNEEIANSVFAANLNMELNRLKTKVEEPQEEKPKTKKEKKKK